MTEDLSKDLDKHLFIAGVTVNGEPQRSWFEDSVERSRGFLELGKIESEKELQRVLDGDV